MLKHVVTPLSCALYTVDMEGQRHGRRGSVELPGGGRAMSPSASGGGGSAGGVSHGGGGGGSVTSGLDANAGPRIFVGKLNRATTEADVREYFTRCARVPSPLSWTLFALQPAP